MTLLTTFAIFTASLILHENAQMFNIWKKKINTETKPYALKKKLLTREKEGDKIQNTQKRNKKNIFKRIRTFYSDTFDQDGQIRRSGNLTTEAFKKTNQPEHKNYTTNNHKLIFRPLNYMKSKFAAVSAAAM